MNIISIMKRLGLALVGVGLVLVAKKCFVCVYENTLFFDFLLGFTFFFIGVLSVLLAITVFIAFFDDL